MARWLVTGAAGMLGREVTAALAAAGQETTALGRADLDITDSAAVKAAVAGHDLVVNAAAWTDVDAAESREAEATAVNGLGVRHLAAACAAVDARLLHVSTDYVFPGDAPAPIPEDAAPAPVNAYGRGKLAGEQAVNELLPETGYVVRTAWLYGEHGKNFVSTILRAARDREFLDVVDDQHGQPTSARTLAARLVQLGRAAHEGGVPAGVYHGTCSGQTTWCGLARAAFELCDLDPARVRATTSDRFPRPAPRPTYSVLGHDRWAEAGFAALPQWRESLAEALASSGLRHR
jgi:dTDP-4-dehydrorhamnose reductase